MRLTHAGLIRCSLQLLDGKLANRLQHPVARIRSAGEEPHQALVDERGDALLHIDALVEIHDSLRRVESPPTGKDAEASEEGLLVWREEVVAPGDGVAESALTCRGISPSTA